MILTRFFLASSLFALLSGCVIAVNTEDWEDEAWFLRQKQNAEKIEDLELGHSEVMVRADLGEPDFVESFTRDGETFRVLYYRTHHNRHDGDTTKDETTPLVFVDNNLVGWGESAIIHATGN